MFWQLPRPLPHSRCLDFQAEPRGSSKVDEHVWRSFPVKRHRFEADAIPMVSKVACSNQLRHRVVKLKENRVGNRCEVWVTPPSRQCRKSHLEKRVRHPVRPLRVKFLLANGAPHLLKCPCRRELQKEIVTPRLGNLCTCKTRSEGATHDREFRFSSREALVTKLNRSRDGWSNAHQEGHPFDLTIAREYRVVSLNGAF